MKRFSGERARYRAIRTDQPEIEAKLLRDRQSEGMPSSGHQHNFDAGAMGAPQSHQIAFGNLKLRIEQRAVDVGRQQSDGSPGNLHYL